MEEMKFKQTRAFIVTDAKKTDKEGENKGGPKLKLKLGKDMNMNTGSMRDTLRLRLTTYRGHEHR